MEDVIVIVGETGDLLRSCISHVHNLQNIELALGLRIAALDPANLLTGKMAKLFIVAGGQAICQIDRQFRWLMP